MIWRILSGLGVFLIGLGVLLIAWAIFNPDSFERLFSNLPHFDGFGVSSTVVDPEYLEEYVIISKTGAPISAVASQDVLEIDRTTSQRVGVIQPNLNDQVFVPNGTRIDVSTHYVDSEGWLGVVRVNGPTRGQEIFVKKSATSFEKIEPFSLQRLPAH
jgi:hypothetical protein